MARIGILTGGGDCPGLNAVIRAIVRRGTDAHGHEFFGFSYGWAGVLEGQGRALDLETTRGILPRGGTILGTSRTNPFQDDGPGTEGVRAGMERAGVEMLIPIGGEDTLGVAGRLADAGIPVVGVPKTIDNDLAGTDFTFGFETAVQIATDAIDRLHSTAESHNRVIVVEVMGRHVGWIAAYSGMAGGADAILVPERPFDIDEVCARLRRRHDRGGRFSIVVVSEGAHPVGELPAARTARPTPSGTNGWAGLPSRSRSDRGSDRYESRMTILGHVQRGGTPNAFDRVLGSRFGVAAADAIARGETGTMVALRGTEIATVPLSDALAEPKLLDPEFFEAAEVFFG